MELDLALEELQSELSRHMSPIEAANIMRKISKVTRMVVEKLEANIQKEKELSS